MLRRVFQYPDGSQVLVQTSMDERGEVTQTIATRPDGFSTWGPPHTEQFADDDAEGIGP